MAQQPGYLVLDGWTTEVNKPCQERLRSAGEIERGLGYSAKKTPTNGAFCGVMNTRHHDRLSAVAMIISCVFLLNVLTTDRVCSK